MRSLEISHHEIYSDRNQVRLSFKDGRALKLYYDTFGNREFDRLHEVSLIEEDGTTIARLNKETSELKSNYNLTAEEILPYLQRTSEYASRIFPTLPKNPDRIDAESNYWRAMFEVQGITSKIKRELKIS